MQETKVDIFFWTQCTCVYNARKFSNGILHQRRWQSLSGQSNDERI